MKRLFAEATAGHNGLAASRVAELLEVDREHGGIDEISTTKPAVDNKICHEIQNIVSEMAGSGYRMVTHHLVNRVGRQINHKRVFRLMKEMNLLHKKRKSTQPRTTDSNHKLPVFENLTSDLELTTINQLWVGDITYIKLRTGNFVYLATVLDAYSRRCIGYAMDNNMRAELCTKAMEMAIETRIGVEGIGRIDDKSPIFHSDRGSQYASSIHRELLYRNGIRGSMSARGKSGDNAKAESFFRTLKVEEVYLSEYQNLIEARSRIQSFIENIYNRKRLHSSLGYRSPAQFEQALLVEQQVA